MVRGSTRVVLTQMKEKDWRFSPVSVPAQEPHQEQEATRCADGSFTSRSPKISRKSGFPAK